MEKEIEQIDLEEVIKSYKVTNEEIFTSYLKELWIDFAQRNDDKAKGISKLTFASYYNLPGIILDRLFSVIDANKSGVLEAAEFTSGMITLFCGDFDINSKFIFDFYDFDKDGKITKEDIRTVLSYISLSKEIQNYKDRVNSQGELFDMIEKCFKTVHGESIDYVNFKQLIENVSSDLYLLILLFLYEKRPFNKTVLASYEKQKELIGSPSKKGPKSPTSKLLASPTKSNAFSPYKLMQHRTGKRQTTIVEDVSSLNKKFQATIQRNHVKRMTVQNNDTMIKLMPFGSEPCEEAKEGQDNQIEDKQIYNSKPTDPNECSSPVHVNRKLKINLKEIGKKNIASSGDYNDLKIQPAFKQIKTASGTKGKGNVKESSEGSVISGNNIIEEENEEGLIFANVIPSEDEDDEDENMATYQGYLYKLAENKLKKVWFKLVHKDLFYFKNDKDNLHKGMHNLSGVFIQEEKSKVFVGRNFFCFSLVYPKKTRYYYIEKESEYKSWISFLKKATEFTDITELYEVGEKIGSGKFGLIKAGINKKTGNKVAIKIMSKKDMDTSDLELVRTEIEILKICQHPNIIQLYEVFENIDYFYIMMEYCSGGDLFEHLEKKGFKIPESRACNLMHKMCAAMFYVHSYGVAHRDLKPENILMMNKNDDADIRILDFGLSKILGPDEKCTEPYGTLSYVAPEVLLDQPYTKEVDLWSLGVITYLLLSGSLPFDHKNDEEEIARKTVMEPPPYKGTIWKKVSPEAKDFVDRLLIKDPKKRMNIKEALEHEWFQKFGGKDVTQARRKSKEYHSSTFELYSSVEVKDFNSFKL